MKSYIMAVLAVALFGAIVTVGAEGDGEKGDGKGKGKHGGKWGGMMNMTCLGESFKKEAMWKGAKDCMAEMKAAGGEEKKDGDKKKKHCRGKNMCMKVCMWKKQGILNADGDFDSAGAAEYVKSLLTSEKAVNAVTPVLNNCASEISGDKALRTDKNCSGYAKFKECQWKGTMKACGNEEMLKKMEEKVAEWKKKHGDKGGVDEAEGADAQA